MLQRSGRTPWTIHVALFGDQSKWFLDKLGKDDLPKLLAGFEDKTGYAMTIFAYLESEDAQPLLFVGKTDGSIVAPRGGARFGWDPNFEETSTKKTYAEMDRDEKNTLSHRGKAARKMIEHFIGRKGASAPEKAARERSRENSAQKHAN